MSDLSLWYERELSWFRKHAGKFAEDHPGLARSLGVSDEAVEDPDVSRLVESFALLNARLSCQLDEELPQLTDSLLRMLFPHFLRPLPCVGMMQIRPSEDIGSVQEIPRGSTFRARIDDDRFCDFRTCSPLQMLPFELADAEVEQAPFSRPAPRNCHDVGVMLRLDLAMCDNSLQFHSIGQLSRLDIHLKGELNLTQRLYDQLFSQVCCLSVFDDSGLSVVLPDVHLEPVLMSEDERVLPLSGNSFSGYQLLLEYLNYQNVFLSFRISGLDKVLSRFSGNRLSIGIYLKSMPVELSRSLSAETFQLGCVPVVNLFQRKGEPLKVDQTSLGYPLVIDTRSANAQQVFSVDSVLDISGLRPEPVPEIYGHKYFRRSSYEKGCFWHYLPADSSRSDSCPHGELALTDLNLNPVQPSQHQLSPRLTCSNADQPLELSLLHDLTCLENIAIPATPRMMGKVSPCWQPSLSQENRWVLLAHLQMNFDTLLGGEDPAAELRELLSLYNLNDHASQRRCIEAITAMVSEKVVAPLKVHGRQCYVQGTDITLTLDAARISGVSLVLFIQVLDRMMAGFAGHNSFTRLMVCLKGEPGVFYQCPRRHG
ncbi:type VI secretion system baseplate subunit TssF [Sansalvadorimonas sp. 2012CJ34-2]|uniref:Type VI secretion system baseplate subunit TssF n=1 Tax=Parendozoicomonas callyspongiae TaxID=2942213 RepID=A0ABT0PJ69_9GAMM|nr:type VI secretion system baseplate subunit TssF [Sansalvadorimonas sp. 2012CJ34-2]MCL6271445.1 type VI secretion system baseplate subunit TssF [Sansalvadorimonas sp. 2012CJ34-2]